MPIYIEERPSDSPYIERVWRSRSENINRFISIGNSRWDLVFTKHQGKSYVSIQGPESQATSAPVPDNAEFFGIVFKLGAYMPHLPTGTLVDGNVTLSDATSRSFWLQGSAWELPSYDNAEAFVERLVRREMLVREPTVDEVMRGGLPDMSLRSIQRRFLHTTGLTYRTIQQIERARKAAILLREGSSILDTTYDLGYFDQAYLTKSLRHFIGQTPTQLTNFERAEQLSLLYKTPTLS
jgi:hypothetical protein